MQKFRGCCVLAYECGYREEDVALMFTELCDRGVCPVAASNVPQCMELACIVWETLEQSAKAVKRWSQGVMLDLPPPKCCTVLALLHPNRK